MKDTKVAGVMLCVIAAMLPLCARLLYLHLPIFHDAEGGVCFLMSTLFAMFGILLGAVHLICDTKK